MKLFLLLLFMVGLLAHGANEKNVKTVNETIDMFSSVINYLKMHNAEDLHGNVRIKLQHWKERIEKNPRGYPQEK